jgi:hypothetical protein
MIFVARNRRTLTLALPLPPYFASVNVARSKVLDNAEFQICTKKDEQEKRQLPASSDSQSGVPQY